MADTVDNLTPLVFGNQIIEVPGVTEDDLKALEADGLKSLNTLLDTNSAVERVRQASDEPTSDGRPRPEWVRGICPQCGDDLVANCYYVAARGYLVTHDCWSSQGDHPTCAYRKVL